MCDRWLAWMISLPRRSQRSLFGNIIIVPVPIPSAQDFNNDDDKGQGREWVGGCADSRVALSKMDAGGEGSGPTFEFDLSGVLAD